MKYFIPFFAGIFGALVSLSISLMIILSCSTKPKSAPSPQPTITQQLQQQIDRISPNLLWCYGMPSLPAPNNITEEPNCDIGDGVYNTGILLSNSNTFPDHTQSMTQALNGSFDINNQPFRNPSYVGKDTSNEYSRDQTVGLALAASNTHTQPLQTLFTYLTTHDSLCPHPTDLRCTITPLVYNTWNIALGTSTESTVDSAEFLASSLLLSKDATYEVTLQLMELIIRFNKGFFNTNYNAVVDNLLIIQPNNLLAQYLKAWTSTGNFSAVANQLLICMEQFTTPGINEDFTSNVVCAANSSGHRMVWLANMLIDKLQ